MTFSRTSRVPASVLALGALALLFTALTFLLASCGGSTSTTATTAGAGSGGGNNVQVAMINRSYDPGTVTVKVGDTVVWTNQSSIQHDVVADNGEFKSKLFGQGETFSYTFTKAGTYPYHCSIHPGMTGTVIVQ